MSRFQDVSCVLCDGNDTEPFITGSDVAQIVRCLHDGMIYLNPRFTRENVEAKFQDYIPRVDMFVAFKQPILKREAKYIQTYKASGIMLDIGCSVGTLFEYFNSDLWVCYGLDPSSYNADAAKKNYNADVFTGVLREANYSDKFFDVVTIIDTIYYLPDILEDLKNVYRILKDDGILAIEIQGFNYSMFRDRGPICYLLDKKWSRIVPGDRLYYFTPNTLTTLLKLAGFQVQKVLPEQAVFAHVGLLKTLNNIHFNVARTLFNLTRGKVSIAARELYICSKN